MSLPMITLGIDFVLYSPIDSNDELLGRKQSLIFYIQILNRTVAKNYIHINNIIQ